MNLQNKIIETIKTKEIQNVSSDIADVFIDSVLEDGLLKEIPIIGSIVGLGKGIMCIQDRLFAKKLLVFLEQLKSIPENQRIKQIEKIENNKREKIKVGEKLLYLIQNCDDHLKSEIIGLLFAAYLSKEIDYEIFKRCSDCIIKAYIDLIYEIVESEYERLFLEESQDLINCGLFEMSPSIHITENSPNEELGGKYSISGYDETGISTLGKTIRKILKDKISN